MKKICGLKLIKVSFNRYEVYLSFWLVRLWYILKSIFTNGLFLQYWEGESYEFRDGFGGILVLGGLESIYVVGSSDEPSFVYVDIATCTGKKYSK